MGFEAHSPAVVKPRQRIVKIAEKEEKPISRVFRGEPDSMEFEARPSPVEKSNGDVMVVKEF